MKAIAFVDHEIGHLLLSRILCTNLCRKISLLAVVTSKENGTKWWPGVEELARQHSLPLLRYPEDSEQLRNLGPADYYFLLSWKYLMPEKLLALPRIGTLNLHYSLLPKYRGVYPVNWALIKGEVETGVSFHWVNSTIDAGPVVSQRSLPILAEDTARSLQLRMDDLACALFDELAGLLATLTGPPSGTPPPPPGSDYFSRESFELTNELDLEKTYQAKDLINLIRGKTFPPHGQYLYFKDPDTGKKIYLNIVLTSSE